MNAPDYWKWIDAHQPTNPRGQCFGMTKRMKEVFPELRRVRGHYTCSVEGQRHTHWWMERADGTIIDPTAAQFPSNGLGDYEEYTGPEPLGKCLNCGELLYVDSAFCNASCAAETVEFMQRGGSIFVNGEPLVIDGQVVDGEART